MAPIKKKKKRFSFGLRV